MEEGENDEGERTRREEEEEDEEKRGGGGAHMYLRIASCARVNMRHVMVWGSMFLFRVVQYVCSPRVYFSVLGLPVGPDLQQHLHQIGPANSSRQR